MQFHFYPMEIFFFTQTLRLYIMSFVFSIIQSESSQNEIVVI